MVGMGAPRSRVMTPVLALVVAFRALERRKIEVVGQPRRQHPGVGPALIGQRRGEGGLLLLGDRQVDLAQFLLDIDLGVPPYDETAMWQPVALEER